MTALDSLADAAGADAVGLMVELARDAVFRLQYAAGQEWAARAAAASRALADPLLVPVSLAIYARALAWGGDAGRGEAIRSEAAALIDASVRRRSRSPARRPGRSRRSGDLSRPLRARPADTASARCKSDGNRPGPAIPGVNATLGVAWCMLGRLAEAAELLDAAIEAGRLSGNPRRSHGPSSVARSWRSPPATPASRSRPPRRASISHCRRSDRHRRTRRIGPRHRSHQRRRADARDRTPARQQARTRSTLSPTPGRPTSSSS